MDALGGEVRVMEVKLERAFVRSNGSVPAEARDG